MRLDDLQILRAIDDMEQHGQYIGNGINLLQRLADKLGFPYHEAIGDFAKELVLAHDAGCLKWRQMNQWGTNATPTIDPNLWLHTIQDIELTLYGRDRARGRVIEVDLPDPTEDDNRMITGLTLEEIGRAIGDTYTRSQLPRYLRDAGIPAEFIPPTVLEDKAAYVFDILSALHDGGSSTRRSLREFIGGWLDGRHHSPPRADVRKRIVTILAQQGWHVKEGRLVIGERQYSEPGTVTPLGRDLRLGALHPEIRCAYCSEAIETTEQEVFVAGLEDRCE